MREQELLDIQRGAREALARAARTTPGPWGLCHDEILTDPGVDRLFVLTEELLARPPGNSYNVACVGLASNPDSLPDGEFIAAARHDVVALATNVIALVTETRRAQQDLADTLDVARAQLAAARRPRAGWLRVASDQPPAGERVLAAWPWWREDGTTDWVYGSAIKARGDGEPAWLDEAAESVLAPAWWQRLPDAPAGSEG